MSEPTSSTPLSEAEWQQIIRDELGQPDAGDANIVKAYAALDENLPKYWRMFADKQSQGYRMRYLYTKLKAIELLMGHMWQAVTNTDADVSESLSDLYEHLKDMKDDIEAAIAGATASRGASRGVAVGVITVTAPIETGPFCNDPNSRHLKGDPLRRGWYRGGR